MNVTEKKRFIRDLIKSVQDSILENVNKMPEEWDGIELRQYIADTFMHQTHSLSLRVGITSADRKRMRDYKNELIVRNL